PSAPIVADISAGGHDRVYERYSLFSDTAARLSAPTAPNAVPIPSILEVNAPLIAEQRRHRSLADEAGARAATERQLRGASLISCVSEPVAQWTRQEGADPARVGVTPHGGNTTRITPAPAPGAASALPATVGVAGGLRA